MYKNNLQKQGVTKCTSCQEAQELGLLQRTASVTGSPVAGGLVGVEFWGIRNAPSLVAVLCILEDPSGPSAFGTCTAGFGQLSTPLIVHLYVYYSLYVVFRKGNLCNRA